MARGAEMNRDDIIRMAREAGYGKAMADLHAPALERFAAIVAAHENVWKAAAAIRARGNHD